MPTFTVSATDKSTRLCALIEAAKAPLALKKLAQQLKLSASELQTMLTSEMESGRIHRWPDQRGQQRFWHSSADGFTRDQILSVAAECAVTPAVLAKQVKKRLPPYPAKLITAAIQQLLREKKLQKYALIKREDLLGRTGYPSAFAAAAELAIAGIRERVAAIAGPATAAPKVTVTLDLEGAILEAITRLAPSRTAPVSTRELRSALPQASKAEFDQAARNLRQQRRAYLSRHDFPLGLSAEERDSLIDGQDGSFYVAITARDE